MQVHLQREIERLKKRILAIGALVEDSLQKAVRALRSRDPDLAALVIRTDAEIDDFEVEIEEECLKILALYQPVAHDLRFVIAVLKINGDLERIGDQAVNIAERAQYLSGRPPLEIPLELTTMVEKVQGMLKSSLDALVNGDEGQAMQVILQDDEIDALHRTMYDLVQDGIKTRLDLLDCYINILSVSRQLERVADQVTNIAEDVIYLVRGSIVRHSGG